MKQFVLLLRALSSVDTTRLTLSVAAIALLVVGLALLIVYKVVGG